MNEFTVLEISDGNDTFTYKDVRIEKNLSDTHIPNYNVVELNNAVYYSFNETMKSKSMSFTARLNKDNDFIFKRFINQKNKRFTLKLLINGVEFITYAYAGNQFADVSYDVIKVYEFDLMISSRALLFEKINQSNGINSNDLYNKSLYNKGKYSSLQQVGVFLFNYINDGDTSAYFTIQGKGIEDEVKFTINNTEIKFNLPSLGLNDEFFYSNIPLNLEVAINGFRRLDILELSTNTFEVISNNGSNSFLIEGLQDVVVNVVKGYVIL